MAALTLQFTDHGLGWLLDDAAKDTIHRATAGALNNVAFKGRGAVIGGLPRHFTIRNRYTERGIRVKRANRRDSHLEAHVYAAGGGSRRPGGGAGDYLKLHVEGGTRRGKKGIVAIPVGARKTKSSKTGPASWPANMLRRRKRAFSIKFKNGKGTGIFIRVGRRKNSRIKLMWLIRESVEIPRNFPFFELARDEAGRHWPDAMRESMNHQMKSAKKKAKSHARKV